MSDTIPDNGDEWERASEEHTLYHHTDREGQIAEDLAANQPDLDFLDEEVTSEESNAILNDLRQLAETLTQLEFEYVTANEKAEAAKKRYDEFRCVTVPNAFRMAGVTGIETASGTRVSIERKYHCSPNKNEADQIEMCNWIEKMGGSDLIEKKAIVDAVQIQKLIDASIPHSQDRTVNTNKLKAWIKRELGDDHNVGRIKIKDIPACMHFICIDEAEIKV